MNSQYDALAEKLVCLYGESTVNVVEQNLWQFLVLVQLWKKNNNLVFYRKKEGKRK